VARFYRMTVQTRRLVEAHGHRCRCQLCFQDIKDGEVVRTTPHHHALKHKTCYEETLH
jgi:hypothetical protein